MTSIVIGLDPSLTAFGWAVVSAETPPRVLAAGCVQTKPDTRSRHLYQADQDGARVDAIAVALLRVLRDAQMHGQSTPAILVAIEAPAGAQHAAAAKALGLSYGVARAVCAAECLTPITVQAHEVKLAVGGSKGASKDDVAAGVLAATGWSSTARTGPAREGEADAVGVALTALRHPLVATTIGRAGIAVGREGPAPARIRPKVASAGRETATGRP